jgi:ABC-type multidrug transport system ATPase subunit
MIRFQAVTFSYTGSGRELDNLSLTVGRGLTLLAGPNGAGKSTLLRVAGGIEKPDRGKVTLNGLDLWEQEAAARAGLAFLPDHADLTPYATLSETLGMVCRVRRQPAGLATERLGQVGLAGLGGRSIRELSFGQRRRAMLAAVMIGEPPILLLDEPLDGMDAEMRLFILDWIGNRLEAGAAILTASHEMDTFGPLATHAVGLKDGRLLASVDHPGRETLDHLARGLPPP